MEDADTSHIPQHRSKDGGGGRRRAGGQERGGIARRLGDKRVFTCNS